AGGDGQTGDRPHRRPGAAREWWVRRPALLHPERVPDHDAAAPRGGPVRPRRPPRLLDPPHLADLAAVLPADPHRLLRAPGARWAARDHVPSRPAAGPPAAVPGVPGQLVDGPGPAGARLDQRALERLRRGAILPGCAAVHRDGRPALPVP